MQAAVQRAFHIRLRRPSPQLAFSPRLLAACSKNSYLSPFLDLTFLPGSIILRPLYSRSLNMTDHQEHHDCTKGRICCIIPNYLLQHVVSNQEAPANARACAARSLLHNARLRGARQSHSVQHSQAHQDAFNGIVPLYMHQEILDSPDASDEQKDRARKNLEKSASIRASREGVVAPTAAAPRPKRLFRVLYDSERTNELPGDRLRTEKQVATLDTQGTNVWNYFGKTFEFYYEKFHRNSIDDLGMSMVGSIHYDDEEVSHLSNRDFMHADVDLASPRLR
jgi:Thermolysin metallopeptidase, catalytic domain